MGKGGKRLQNAYCEIELLQQDLEDAFHEIDKLHKLDNSIGGNFFKEIVDCTRKCISELTEKLE